jgi:predicted small secreted protein
MNPFYKIIFVILTMVTLSVSLSACNTLRGFGRDLQSTGEAIQHTIP